MDDLKDWISLSEAAARLPSPQTGKRTHPSTVYRLAKKHGLAVRKFSVFRFVYWPDVVNLFKPEEVKQPRPALKPNSSRRTLGQFQKDMERAVANGIA